MIGWIVGLIVACWVVMLIARQAGKKALKDKKNFDDYVAKKNLSIEEQKELCERFGLDHQIGNRAYDSVEDWQQELTVIWAGKAEPIEFTYRKYDERERRSISPTEFGYDGNKKPYIKGICHKSGEPRTFKTIRIETKIKVGSKRYDLGEWLESCLSLNVAELQNSLDIKL
jgi:gas vesicle protein